MASLASVAESKTFEFPGRYDRNGSAVTSIRRVARDDRTLSDGESRLPVCRVARRTHGTGFKNSAPKRRPAFEPYWSSHRSKQWAEWRCTVTASVDSASTAPIAHQEESNIIPIAAGILYPAFGLLLSPIVGALAMSLSSVSVIVNALRLRTLEL